MDPTMFQPVPATSLSQVVELCKDRALMLYIRTQAPFPLPGGGPQVEFQNTPQLGGHELMVAGAIPGEPDYARQEKRDLGVHPIGSRISVELTLLNEIQDEFRKEDSDIRRLSCLPRDYAFVYLDISDFSKYKPAQQALVVNSVRCLANAVNRFCRPPSFNLDMEAIPRLCIGDGYIFVLTNPLHATWFGACLARLIVEVVAKNLVPVEFHFRMGLHWGPVYHFWDEGRNNWNYIGAGINGGNRVLSVIGKDQDDVVFLSSAVHDWLIANNNSHAEYSSLLGNMTNRGRRKDKHDRYWRVFEIDYMAAYPVVNGLPVGRRP